MKAKIILKGGKGSGNFGHSGRPGKVGGSGGDEFSGMEGRMHESARIKSLARSIPKEDIGAILMFYDTSGTRKRSIPIKSFANAYDDVFASRMKSLIDSGLVIEQGTNYKLTSDGTKVATLVHSGDRY